MLSWGGKRQSRPESSFSLYLARSLARSLTAQAKNIVGITRYLSYNLLVWWMLVVGKWDRDRGKEEERLVVW